MKQPIRQEKIEHLIYYVYPCEKCGIETRRHNRIADRYMVLCEKCRKAKYKQRLIDNDAKHDSEIRADERAKVLEELNETIMPTLYEYDVDEEVIGLCKRVFEQLKEQKNDKAKLDS